MAALDPLYEILPMIPEFLGGLKAIFFKFTVSLNANHQRSFQAPIWFVLFFPLFNHSSPNRIVSFSHCAIPST